MKPTRIADIVFFLGAAGILYAILYGSWHTDDSDYPRTIAIIVFGTILVIGSFIYLYRNKPRDDSQK